MNSRLFVSALFLSAAFAPQIANAQYGLSSSSISNGFGYISAVNAKSVLKKSLLDLG